MKRQKAARNSCNYSTPKNVHYQDENRIAEYDRATLIAGVIIMLSFGVMMLVGAWQAW